MKKLIYILFIFLSAFLAKSSYAQMNGPAKHVILISIDGFKPHFYLDDKWPARTLQTLAHEGVNALGVRPVYPSITKPDHVTMITGAFPAKHGIYYNNALDPAYGDYGNAKQIKVETIWDAVKKAGGTSGSVNWPASVEAPVNWNFRSYNPTFFNTKEFQEEIETNLLGKSPFDPKSGSDFDSWASDIKTAAAGAYIIEKHKPNFMTVHFLSTDHFEGEQGLEGEKVTKSIAVIDVGIGQIIEATKKAGIYNETAFIICGDHGFENKHTQLAWNTLLIKDGLMENKPGGGNWKAYFNGQFLMLKDKNDQKTLARVKQLLAGQPASIRKLFRIIDRKELDELGADPNPAMAIQTIEGVVSTGSISSPDLVQPTSGGTHGLLADRPSLYAGFIAFGAGINKNITIPVMGMENVASVIAAALGVPFNAPDGVLFPGILLTKKKASEE